MNMSCCYYCCVFSTSGVNFPLKSLMGLFPYISFKISSHAKWSIPRDSKLGWITWPVPSSHPFLQRLVKTASDFEGETSSGKHSLRAKWSLVAPVPGLKCTGTSSLSSLPGTVNSGASQGQRNGGERTVCIWLNHWNSLSSTDRPNIKWAKKYDYFDDFTELELPKEK